MNYSHFHETSTTLAGLPAGTYTYTLDENDRVCSTNGSFVVYQGTINYIFIWINDCEDCGTCIAAITCSGHGTCNLTAQCQCNAGFAGPNCSSCAGSYYYYPYCSSILDIAQILLMLIIFQHIVQLQLPRTALGPETAFLVCVERMQLALTTTPIIFVLASPAILETESIVLVCNPTLQT